MVPGLKQLLRHGYRLYKKSRGVKERKIPRSYIAPELGVEGFFMALKKEKVRYAVLRWFDILPILDVGEDIDILVMDEDLPKVNNLLRGIKGDGIPCDIYTCGGLPGTDHRGVPYFPTHKAEELIEHTIFKDDLIRVPAPYYHFLSMAYHVVYHKGYASSLYSNILGRRMVETCDHDYIKVLRGIAQEGNFEAPEMTLEALNYFLDAQGWKPQTDTLKKLSRKNQWINDYLSTNKSELENILAGMTVFIVREQGLPYLDDIRTILSLSGFDIIGEKEISGAIQEQAIRNIRGGNWNKGPWPVSGGLPAYSLLVYDYLPLAPDKALALKHPGISNGKIHGTKIKIRDYINSLRPKEMACNAIHSADSADEATEYCRTLYPMGIDPLTSSISERASRFITPYPVVQDLSKHANRAKVELVSYKGENAICKTFKPGLERFLEREILARKLGADIDEISKILEAGENYIILVMYENHLNELCRMKPLFQNVRLLPIWIIKKLVHVIRCFRVKGYELIDFSPTNILCDTLSSIKIIDFEFLQEGKDSTPSLKGNYAWYPTPDNFDGDLPINLMKSKTFPYKKRWQHWTGLPLTVCLRAEEIPSFLLFMMQVLYVPFISLWRIPKETGRVLLRLQSRIRERIRNYIR